MKKLLGKIALLALLAAVPLQAEATPYYLNKQVYTIRGDSGGVILRYALRVKKMEKRGSFVRFAGRCDSACTLFLGMPKNKVCLTRGAYFRFHRPYGSTAKNNAIAARFMMRNYPGWVRSWINRNGGLTGRLKTMDYGYASQYLPKCNETEPKRTPFRLASFSNRGR